MTAEQTLQTLTKVVAERFDDDERVAAIYLFGSAARATGPPPRDLDLALLVEPCFDERLDYDFTIRTKTFLEEETGVPVDVILLNTADPVLQYQVRRDGRLLLERNRAARIDWEVLSRKLWFDRQPAHRRYMKKLEERLLTSGDAHGG